MLQGYIHHNSPESDSSHPALIAAGVEEDMGCAMSRKSEQGSRARKAGPGFGADGRTSLIMISRGSVQYDIILDDPIRP